MRLTITSAAEANSDLQVNRISESGTRCHDISFGRLKGIAPEALVDHMNDPRIAEHLPLLTQRWSHGTAVDFISAKEARRREDGLGHWAILCDGHYAGWGGFELTDGAWDFGLVLRPEYFGAGMRISRLLIDFARLDRRIPYITFHVPPSRRHLRALIRLGTHPCGSVEQGGAVFRKYCLSTPTPALSAMKCTGCSSGKEKLRN